MDVVIMPDFLLKFADWMDWEAPIMEARLRYQPGNRGTASVLYYMATNTPSH